MGPKANPTVSMFKTKFYNRNSLKLGDLLIGCFLVLVLILILIFLLSQFFLLFHLYDLLSKCFCFHLPALSW